MDSPVAALLEVSPALVVESFVSAVFVRSRFQIRGCGKIVDSDIEAGGFSGTLLVVVSDDSNAVDEVDP